MPDTQPILRFAPSPTGYLHLGHAYSALECARWAKRLSGKLLLRIEDTDPNRCRQEYVDAIFEDLDWLGIGFEPDVRRQSEHLKDYQPAIAQLKTMGLAYPCAASRAEIARAAGDAPRRDPDGAIVFRGRGRYVPEPGAPYALRLDMARALDALSDTPTQFQALDENGLILRTMCRPERWGDVVLVGKDRPVSYHLAVVVDDALQDVSHVVRGEDLLASTDVHRVLQQLLGLPEPLYHHHRLIVPDGRSEKLSKRLHDKSLRTLRAEGVTPDGVKQLIGITC